MPTIQGLCRWFRDKLEKSGQKMVTEREKKLETERKLLDVELAKATNKVRDIDEVQKEWNEIATTVRQKLLGFPSRLAPRLIYAKDQTDMAKQIDDEIRDVLTELSRQGEMTT